MIHSGALRVCGTLVGETDMLKTFTQVVHGGVRAPLVLPLRDHHVDVWLEAEDDTEVRAAGVPPVV